MTAVLAAALGLGLVHLAVGRVGLRAVRTAHVRSTGGGVAVAYVFVHALPELAARQSTVRAVNHRAVELLEAHTYLAALLGFLAFYWVEHAARAAGEATEGSYGRTFQLHVMAFGVYNALALFRRQISRIRELLTSSQG